MTEGPAILLFPSGITLRWCEGEIGTSSARLGSVEALVCMHQSSRLCVQQRSTCELAFPGGGAWRVVRDREPDRGGSTGCGHENADAGSLHAAPVLFDFFFFSSRRRHTRLQGDWSSDVCSSD